MKKQISDIIGYLDRLDLILEGKNSFKAAMEESCLDKEGLVRIKKLCENLMNKYDGLSQKEKELLEYDYNLKEIHFYIKKISSSNGNIPKERIKDAFDIIEKRINSLKITHDNRGIKPGKTDRDLMLSLAKYSKEIYDGEFQRYFSKSEKGYVDKFSRDHWAGGFPDYLFEIMQNIASGQEKFDYLICNLRGGLTYALIFELMGFPKDRIHYIICGKGSGRLADSKAGLRFNDFQGMLKRVGGKKVLAVDNLALTGDTIAALCEELKRAGASRISVFVDHAGRHDEDSIKRLSESIDEAFIGRSPKAERWHRALLQGLSKALMHDHFRKRKQSLLHEVGKRLREVA